jgi:hypothetical protein
VHRPAILVVLALAQSAGCARADRSATESHPAAAMVQAPIHDGTWEAALEAAWKAAGVEPVGAADDLAFLRRVTLDLLGRIPTPAELDAFERDRSPNKRAAVVDRMLADPAWAEAWADTTAEVLLAGADRKVVQVVQDGLRDWLAEELHAGTPWHVVATEILTAEGDATQGAAGFVAAHLRRGEIENLTGRTARVFLGLSVQCAQCHDHPDDDRYRQADFYGLAASFARTRTRLSRGDGSPEAVVIDRKFGHLRMPSVDDSPGTRTGPRVEPAFPGLALAPEEGETPRRALARAIVASPLFDAAIVGRTWAQLFGRGLAHPWDDLGAAGDPRQPEALRRLAAELAAHDRDLRWLVREIVLSRAYGLASTGPNEGATERRDAFAQFPARPMTDDQLLASLLVATGVEDSSVPRLRRVVRERRAALEQQFAFTFDDDEMAAAEARGATIGQALLLLNGELTSFGTLARAGTTLDRILAAHEEPEARIDAIYSATVGRRPDAPRREELVAFVAQRDDGAAAYEDLMYALLASSEFTTIH